MSPRKPAQVPALAQHAPALTPTKTPSLVRAAIAAYEATLGGRQPLIEALSAADELDPAIFRLLQVLADPDHATTPLVDLCARARISPGKLFAAFQTAIRTMQETVAMAAAVRALPDAIAEVAKRTVDHEEVCEGCHGLGEIVPKATKAVPNPSPQPCSFCAGEGTIRRSASLEHQRLLFEYAGVLKKPGIQVNTHVNTGVAVGTGGLPGGSLEHLQQAVSTLLTRRPPLSSAMLPAEVVIAPPRRPDDDRPDEEAPAEGEAPDA